MSIKRNVYLVLDVTNETEGITLSIKTVGQGDNGILITGDVGLYNVEELTAALQEAKAFTREKENVSTS